MTIETENQNEEIPTQTERQMLMARARIMGLTFSNNISDEKLRAKIAEKLSGEVAEHNEDEVGGEDESEQVDEDGDGHDDNNGQFVDGNQEAANPVAEIPAPVVEAQIVQALPPVVPVEPVAPTPRLNPLEDAPAPAPAVAAAAAAPARRLTKAEERQAIRTKLVKEEMKLIRCRITNLNPSKKDLPGEIFTVANRFLGTVKKYVPYGEVTDNGYHLPKCIFDQLAERRFQNIRTGKDRKTGSPTVETGWAKEFALEVLPQLTDKELAELANAQAAAGSVG